MYTRIVIVTSRKIPAGRGLSPAGASAQRRPPAPLSRAPRAGSGAAMAPGRRRLYMYCAYVRAVAQARTRMRKLALVYMRACTQQHVKRRVT